MRNIIVTMIIKFVAIVINKIIIKIEVDISDLLSRYFFGKQNTLATYTGVHIIELISSS